MTKPLKIPKLKLVKDTQVEPVFEGLFLKKKRSVIKRRELEEEGGDFVSP